MSLDCSGIGINKLIKKSGFPSIGTNSPKINLSGIPTNGTTVSFSGFGKFGSIDIPGIPNLVIPKIDGFDLPTKKLIDGFKNGDFPAFTLDKIAGVSAKGLFDKFECSVNNLNSTDGKSMNFKNLNQKLGDNNCDDPTANLDSKTAVNVSLTAALKTNNCSKPPSTAVLSASIDLDLLGLLDPQASAIVDSIIDDKFDIGTAATVLISQTAISKIAESISKSVKTIDKIIKVDNSTHKLKDKDPVIDYAVSISDEKKIASKPDSSFLNLVSDANKDIGTKNTEVPDTPSELSSGQHLTLLSLAMSNSKKMTA